MTDAPASRVDLHCASCGYDLRAAAADGRCPECGASVEQSRRWSLIPRRPAWRDSDPRWRRRMLAGVWILAFVPLMAVIEKSEWASELIVPTPFIALRPVKLGHTFADRTYPYLVFCIGIVLLFSRERDRRPAMLDWTRRWGIVGSYGVLILGIPYFAFVTALVLIGIAALFMAMPLCQQPPTIIINLFVNLGAGYLRYGIHPSRLSDASLPVFSAATVLLACVPLHNALRASWHRVPATIVLFPLVVGSAVQCFDVATYYLRSAGKYVSPDFSPFYFDASAATHLFSMLNAPHWNVRYRFLLEESKWLAVVAIAFGLTLAQLRARSGRAARATNLRR